ncbi:MAG TPA: metallophosphoesterase, partial [Longimicrobiaceae bacterium]|nr:metallophosphoesterase [Longimicrobiaceae bacterium]
AQAAEGVAVAAPEGVARDCTDLLVKYVLAWSLDDTTWMQQIRSEWIDSPCNATGWLQAVDAWVAYYWDGAEPRYVAPAGGGPQPFALPPTARGALRVGILGDWGTGEPEALAVLDQLMQQAPDLIIHVGDVYYAGTEDEQNSNFLTPIADARQKHRRNIPVYALPGNHDYYSGGAGFYGMLARLNQGVPNASVQANSFFCLRNDAWQLQGMDTGYNDSDLLKVAEDNTHLRDDEAAWHQAQLAGAGGRQVILFSHHQLFSAFEQIGGLWQNPSLTANLAAWRAVKPAPNIVGWLWGHEHVLEVYQVPGSLPVLGRCVGNGAFPVFTDSGGYTPGTNSIPLQPATRSPDGKIPFPNGFVQSQPDDLVWASGYTVLNLGTDGSANLQYYQVQFNGSVSAATSQLLWIEIIKPPSPLTLDTSEVSIAAPEPAASGDC